MMTRPTKMVLHRVMSRYCQTSLNQDIVPAHVRILDITSVRQAFETLMRMFTTMMGKLTITAVLEIVFNTCMTPLLPRRYHSLIQVLRSLKYSLLNLKKK